MKRLLAVLALFFALTFSPATAQTPMELQTQADRAFAEKSYARALEGYRAAKAAGAVRDVERVDFRIVQSLFKTEKWDEAIDSANFALKTANWKARFHYLLGQIYVQAPHNGYRLGDKTWRQDEYPEVAGDAKPVRVGFYAEDQKAALENLETAKVEARKERGLAQLGSYVVPIFPMTSDEEIDLNFDLAAFLPQTQFDEFIQSLEKRADGKFDETIDPKAAYASGWSLPRKVLTLYAEIRALDRSDDKADTARSYLAAGLFARAYRGRMDSWAPKYDETTKKTIVRPYPFDKVEAATSWRALVSQLPRSPLAPQALLLIAQEQQSKGKLNLASATFRELISKYPGNKLVSDARAAIAQIEAKEVSFSLSEPARPGTQPKLNLNSRNLKQVQFAAYRVKLEDFLTQKAILNSAETSFTNFSANFGSIAEATRRFGAPVARWTLKPADKSDHQGVESKTVVPVSQIGAYAVVASGNGARFGQIVLISDLALLKKTDKDGSFVFVADAKSGAPIAGANVVMKEVWDYNRRSSDVEQGRSNDAGFFDKKRAAPDRNSQFAAFAWVGNRYAITGQQGGYYGYYGERDSNRVFGTTDRPVYRPGQVVNFRQVLTTRADGGDWKPLVKRSFFLLATDAKGAKLWEGKATTNEFGSLSGTFSLPANVALGVCNLSLSNRRNQLSFTSGGGEDTLTTTTVTTEDSESGATEIISGSTQFRVEEYKRPEFEVTVSAPTEVKRPGETVAARINAKYYFGSPVANAKVKYTVRKSTWWASYHFPSPYDWLYSQWGAGQFETGRRNIGGEGSGEIVKEGEVVTDAQGFAELSFKTDEIEAVDENNWWARYSNPLYTIEAEVTDASRRVIEAQGQVKVARQPFFAFLDTQRGYFQKGDRVPIEIRTQDANEQSVAASGKMTVFKLLPGDREEKVFEAAVSTDASGRAFWNWTASDSGQFRVEFSSRGAWGDEVKAQTTIWVVGDQIGAIRLRGVTILLDKRSYEEGDTLRARIIADKPGASVLLTQEASGDILRRDVIAIDAQSKEISIPIEKKHIPNFFLAAALVQDFEVYQAQTEVFVPPTRQLLNLKVTGDKATYKPGETGVFQIAARDYSGKPARAEVSLALIDASLFYIQSDFTPEMRGFYYGDRRQNSVNLDSSRSGNPEARVENDEKVREYEQHGFELPDDFGQLQLMPGGGYGYYGEGIRVNGAMSYSRRSRGDAVGMSFNGNRTEPMAAMAPASPAPVALRDSRAKELNQAAPQAPVQVRSNFAETAYWSPAVVTEGGSATVRVTFPDSLTQWHATARGLTPTVQVGSAETDVATKKDLLVRLQAPRFFVEKDQVVISANVHNYSYTTQEVEVEISAQNIDRPVVKSGERVIGGFFDPRPPQDDILYFPRREGNGVGSYGPGRGSASPPSVDTRQITIQIKPGEEHRLNWRAEVKKEGKVAVQVTARTSTDSDAVKMSFPVLVHGVQRFAGQSGTMPGNGTKTLTLNFPKERKFGSSQLNLQLNPSLGATMLDALPYLADYPYGCVEQTMSRFLPSVITARTLRDAGINLETLRARAKAYEAEAKSQPLGARVQNSGYSYPKGAPNSRDLTEMASQRWFGARSTNNPVFDKAELDKMTSEGLARLYEMQRGDGGWGWWPGSGQSDEYMSAYVVYGLSQARSAGLAVRADVLNRGRNYLKAQMKDEDNIHLLTYMAYALSEGHKVRFGERVDYAREGYETVVEGRLFEQRERLTPLSRAYLAMTLSNVAVFDKAQVVVRNLENTALIDAANGTARYKTGADYWNWWNNDVETNALVLRAFVQIEPTNKLTPMLMKWLTLQARGNHWRSTKETAESVYSLASYVSKFRELDVDYTLKVSLNSRLARTYRVTKDNALFFDNRFIAGDLFLENGPNKLSIEKSGRGNLYFNAYSEYFSLEEPIKASGNELDISRKFFKLTRPTLATILGRTRTRIGMYDNDLEPADAAKIAPPIPTLVQPQQEYTRTEIKDGTGVTSGDLIEVELVVNAKNDYEYLVFEDMKAAGFEPVEVRSGQSYGDGLSSNVELRDDKVAFFVDRLPQGRRVLRYRVRAEAPGTFHALPTNGYAMYAPEVRAISDEMRVNVKD